MIVVPRPGVVSMSSVPLTRCRRSRMLASPRLGPALGVARIESGAFVADGKQQAPVRLSQRDARGARARHGGATLVSASCATRKRQSSRLLADRRRQVVRGPSPDGEPALAAPPFAFRAQRLDQAKLLEDRRVELVGQRVDVLAEAYELLANRAHHVGLCCVRRGELGAADVDRQHGQPLRHVVVQLAREQRALVLVGADQAPAQVAQRLLGPLGLRDVAQDTERPLSVRPLASRLATRAT